jgi:putative transposase
MMDYQMEYPVGKMCKVFKVSKSRYYEWRKFLSCKRHHENRHLLCEIRRIHQMSKASYGSPRITKELNTLGHKVSRPRVARLMSQSGIRAVHTKKFKVTTDSKHEYPIMKNLLDRNFTVSRKGQVWVSDMTYVRTGKGWMYLTMVMDLFDRKIIGWSMSKNMATDNTTIPAWKMATTNRPILEHLIFHSDRGVQYASNSFAKLVDSYKLVSRSMSRKGDCWDNAVAESFFKTLKVEMIYQTKFECQEKAQIEIFEWIETWYNKNRRHSALGNMTIDEFEKSKQIKNAA